MDLCGRHYPVLTFSIHGPNKPTRVTQKSSTESEGGEDGIFHLAICKACSRIYLRQIRNNEEIETSNAHPHPHVPHSHHTLTHRASSNLSSLHFTISSSFSSVLFHHPTTQRIDAKTPETGDCHLILDPSNVHLGESVNFSVQKKTEAISSIT